MASAPARLRQRSSPSDSEDEDNGARTSIDQARRDQAFLDEEEQREKLLSQKINRRGDGYYESLEKNSGKRRRRGKGKHLRDGEEKRELLYEMEEGGPRSTTPISSSSEDDHERIGTIRTQHRKTSRLAKICRYTMLHVLIAGLFIAIAFGAYKATWDTKERRPARTYRSNGTHVFAPTTILVSLDGFRADFLQRGLTPTLNAFIREGVSPKYMTPSFPSLTFPNHYTLVTGLYPESHGVVGNTFYDPELDEQFFYTHPDAMQPKWWGGEPLWVTAEKQGVRTATHMWPGSEADIGGEIEPAFIDKYNGSEVLPAKVQRILELLDMPGLKDDGFTAEEDLRANLILAYVPNVDADGHLFGPNSTEIRMSITNVDMMMGDLFDGLRQRNLTDVVNVVVVSDHGMATTSTYRTIQLEDLIDPDLIAHIDGWPHYGLRPKDPKTTGDLYAHLLKQASTRDGFDVYLKENMPARYHFSNNERIAPLWLMPHTGWAIVQHEDFNVAEARLDNSIYHPRGIHGYDNLHPLMRSIFIARGPSFPHEPGSRVDVFQNTEVYNILCDSIEITPKPNNGTLRLPFTTDGVHGEDIFEGEEPTLDFSESWDTPDANKPQTQPQTEPVSSPDGGTFTPVIDPADPTGQFDDETDGGIIVDYIDEDGNLKEVSWADWIKMQVKGFKEWVADTFGIGAGDNVEDGPDQSGTAAG